MTTPTPTPTTIWGNRPIPTVFADPQPTARSPPANGDPLNAYGLKVVEAALERYHSQLGLLSSPLDSWRATLSRAEPVPELEAILRHMKTHRFIKLWTCPVAARSCDGCVFCWGHSATCGCEECVADGTFTSEAQAVWRLWDSHVCRADDRQVAEEQEQEGASFSARPVCAACVQAKYFAQIRQAAELRGGLNEHFDFAHVHMLGGESNLAVEPYREHHTAPEPESNAQSQSQSHQGQTQDFSAFVQAAFRNRIGGGDARNGNGPAVFGPALPPAMQAEREAAAAADLDRLPDPATFGVQLGAQVHVRTVAGETAEDVLDDLVPNISPELRQTLLNTHYTVVGR